MAAAVPLLSPPILSRSSADHFYRFPRSSATRNSSMDLRELIASQTDVALSLSKQVLLTTEAKNSNTVLSPLSIHVVLSLIAAGSKGTTQDQLLSYLKTKSGEHLNAFSSELVSVVFADGSGAGGPSVSFANGVWVDKSISLRPSFKQVVDNVYKAASDQVDFQTKAAEVANGVNAWAEKQTKGVIKEVHRFRFSLAQISLPSRPLQNPIPPNFHNHEAQRLVSGEQTACQHFVQAHRPEKAADEEVSTNATPPTIFPDSNHPRWIRRRSSEKKESKLWAQGVVTSNWFSKKKKKKNGVALSACQKEKTGGVLEANNGFIEAASGSPKTRLPQRSCA
ncbi:unnamed protein product [Linum tenue]|uniref:Serpin domain-containing protein n=1 Tax=Linum tenue TaxID=586396 RepID=A0AAV0L3J7_9ROSI|nr:unnamed protein product [Linum tenue]